MRRQDLKAGKLFLATIPGVEEADGGWTRVYPGQSEDKSAEEFYSVADLLDSRGSSAVFAEFWASRGDFADEGPLRWLFLSLYLQNRDGHIRVDLQSFSRWGESLDYSLLSQKQEEKVKKQLKELEFQVEGLVKRSPLLFGAEGSNKPFIISDDRRYLYTLRRYRLESRFIERLKEMSHSTQSRFMAVSDDWQDQIDHFEREKKLELPDAARSIINSLNKKRLVLLSGGPGTGKTTTIARMVLFLNSLPDNTPFRLALGAPTGRAAKRMSESIAREWGGDADQVLAEEKILCGTLHKLLGFSPSRRGPRYNRNNRLAVDLMIIDEASMIDLSVMEALFAALPDHARLLLVGDKDQLPSVEAGALFGDMLFGFGKGKHLLDSSVVLLQKVYRSGKVVLDAANAVREGRRDILEASQNDSFEIYLDRDLRSLYSLCFSRLPEKLESGFSEAIGEWQKNLKEIQGAFRSMDSFALLSATRKGPLGTRTLNRIVAERMGGDADHFFHGQYLMITANDYQQNLFNGDRGIVFVFSGTPYFFMKEGDDFRIIPAANLDSWESSFALTIHKSQGSEFSEVFIFLPEGAGKLMSREILYTGITRARNKVSLMAHSDSLDIALERQVVRHSRIREVVSS